MRTVVFPKYRLSCEAIKRINSKEVRQELLPIFNITEGQLIRKIKNNRPNGDLTTLAAIEVIQRKTKLKRGDLLEEVDSKRRIRNTKIAK